MRVIVAGRGVIGSAIAWRLAVAGHEVTSIDPAPERAAGRIAAGRLAPICELTYGEEAVTRLGQRSNELWPEFAAELDKAAGRSIGYEPMGMLMVARDNDDLAVLDRLAGHQERLALDVERLNARAIRKMEPALAPTVRGGLWVRTDHAVDTSALMDGLAAACAAAGVSPITASVTAAGERHVELDNGTRLDTDAVVLAGGAWLGEIDVEGVTGRLPVRPVKGQILRLRADRRTVAPTHVIDGLTAYLVPREHGEIVVGASVEDLGFDETVTAGVVHELLREMREIVPGIDEMELADASVGYRPATPDNAPLVGAIAGGPILAAGHYRNGILLAPITADAIVELLDSGHAGADMDRFRPQRFDEIG